MQIIEKKIFLHKFEEILELKKYFANPAKTNSNKINRILLKLLLKTVSQAWFHKNREINRLLPFLPLTQFLWNLFHFEGNKCLQPTTSLLSQILGW